MSKSSKTAKLTHRKIARNRAIVPYVAPVIVSPPPVETPCDIAPPVIVTPVETPTPPAETTLADVETITSLLCKLRACASPLVKKRIRAKLRVMGHRGGLRENTPA